MRRGGRFRIWISAAAIAVTATAAPAPLRAESVRIRTGEHDGFTRIVAENGAAGWRLGRAQAGYELRIDAADGFDLSDAFRLISRTRVAALSPGAGPGSLLIDLGCECHARVFETPSGALVIDISDGAPDPASPFEAPLGKVATPSPEDADASGLAADAVSPGAAHLPADDGRARPSALVDPRLALFWRAVNVPEAPPGVTESTGLANIAEATGTQAPARDPARRITHRARPDTFQAAEPLIGDAPPGHGAEDVKTGLPVRIAQEVAVQSDPAQEAPAAQPAAADAESGSEAGAAASTESRLAEAQADVLRQLSRAASQGLVALDTRPGHKQKEGGAGTGRSQPQRDAGPDIGKEPLPIHAETSVDRDTSSLLAPGPLTADGGECLPDSEFSLADWGDERPASIQIAERRGGLVGEFDRPSDESVIGLARLYLYLGFGAESRAVLRSFDVSPRDKEILSTIGLILDGKIPGESAAFADMSGCDGAVALWSVMAWPHIPPMADVDGGAVVRTFSALPPHLRRLLGPGLSERLIGRGLTDDARAIRNAIARAPEAEGPALDMVAAQVDMASGDFAAGERRLDALTATNDPLSPEALILAMESRLARGEAVAPALTDTAGALAFEQKDGANGPRLAALHILGRASTGEFDQAFAAWTTWPSSTSPALRADTAVKLFALLAEKADDATFLRYYFRDRDLMADADPGLLLRLDLAERLSGAGFPDEVDRLLSGEAGLTERGRHLLAAAALARFDPAQAIARLEGAADPAATAMRAEALAMKGDHAAAAAQFRAAAMDARAGLEAWRAGDRTLAASIGPEPVRAALESLEAASGTMPVPADSGDSNAKTPSPGLLASGRQLIRKSEDTRGAIAALLAGFADGALPSATTAGGS